MDITSLQQKLQQQIDQQKRVTLDDATLGTSGVDKLIQASPLAANQITLLTQTPVQQRDAQTLVLAGTTSFLGASDMTTSVIITVTDTATQFVLTGTPADWTLGKGFPAVAGSALANLPLASPALVFTTSEQPDPSGKTVGLQPGLNITGGLTLAQGLANAATVFNVDPSTSVVLQGPARQTGQGPTFDLTGRLNVPTSVGPISLGGGFVGARLTYVQPEEGGGFQPASQLLVGGSIPAGAAPLVLASDLTADGSLDLGLTGANGTKLGGLGHLVNLLGSAAGWTDVLPEQIRTTLDAVTLDDVDVGLYVTPTTRQVAYVTVELGLQIGWQLQLPNGSTAKLESAKARVTWQNPTELSGEYTLDLTATIRVDAYEFDVSVSSDAVITGTLKTPVTIPLAELSRAMVSGRLVGPANLMKAEVENITLTLDIPGQTFTASAEFQADFDFGDRDVKLEQGSVGISFDYGTKDVAGNLSGTLRLGSFGFALGASFGEEMSLTGSLVLDQPLSLTQALNGLPGVSVSLPKEVPDLAVDSFLISFSYPSRALSLSASFSSKWAVAVGNVAPEVDVSLSVTSALNEGGQRTYSGVLSGLLTLGGSLFQITYTAGNGAKLLQGSWQSQGASSLSVPALASGLGIDSTPVVAPVGGMPDFGLQQVNFTADLTTRVVVVAAKSSLFGGAAAFFVASKASGAWGFAFGVSVPGPWKLSQLPGALGTALAPLDFLQFQHSALLVSTASLPLSQVTQAAGGLLDLSQFPAIGNNPAQLAPGLSFAAELDFSGPQQGMARNLSTVVKQNQLFLQGAFGGTASSISFQAVLAGELSLLGSKNLVLSSPRVILKVSPLLVAVAGTLKFPVKSADKNPANTQYVLLDGSLTIETNTAAFALDATFPKPSLGAPVGFAGVTLLEVAASVNVTFEPFAMGAGLEAKFQIGRQTPTNAGFAFVFDVVPEVNPRLLEAQIDRLDLPTLFQAVVPSAKLPQSLSSAIVFSNFFIYWADLPTLLPDKTTAQPGFGFNGAVDLFSIFSAQATLQIFSSGPNAGITGDLEMSPVHLNVGPVEVLSLTGGSKQGGPKIAFSTVRSPYLDVDFDAKLLGSALELQTKATLDGNGFVFLLKWKTPVLEVVFTCNFRGVHDFNASASGTFGVNTTTPALVVDNVTIIPAVHIVAQAKLGLGVIVDAQGFRAPLSFEVDVASYKLSFGATITVAKLEDFASRVEQLLKDPKELFKDALQGAEQLAAALKRWTEAGLAKLANGLDDVAKALKKQFNADSRKALHALYQAGYDLRELADSVKRVYDKTSREIAADLKTFISDVQEIAKVLRAEFDKSSKDTIKILQDIGYGVEDIGRALATKFERSADKAVTLLREAGYAVEDVGAVLKKIYTVADEQAAQLLEAAGYTARDVARALHKVYDAAKQRVAELLKKIGYDVKEIAKALNKELNASEKEVAGLLKGLGYDARDVADGVHEAFDLGLKEMGHLLKDAGYEGQDIAKALRKEYDAGAKDVGRVLKDLGYAKDKVEDLLKSVWDLGKSELKKVLDDIF